MTKDQEKKSTAAGEEEKEEKKSKGDRVFPRSVRGV